TVIESGHESSRFFTENGIRYLRMIDPIMGPYDPIRKSSVMGAIAIDIHLTHADREVMDAFVSTTLLLGSLFTLFLVGMYLLVRRTFVKPLSALTRAAEAFGRGDLSARVAESRDDEIGQLACSFDQMAEQISTSHQQLTAEIAER